MQLFEIFDYFLHTSFTVPYFDVETGKIYTYIPGLRKTENLPVWTVFNPKTSVQIFIKFLQYLLFMSLRKRKTN